MQDISFLLYDHCKKQQEHIWHVKHRNIINMLFKINIIIKNQTNIRPNWETDLKIISLANFFLRSGVTNAKNIIVLGFLHHS